MKIKTIFSTLIIVGVFLISSKSTFAQFADVPVNHPNYEAINFAQSRGMVSGYQDGLYRPENKVTRAEFTKIVMNSSKGESSSNNCDQSIYNFSDVDQVTQSKFGKYICIAKFFGKINGYSDGTFKPHNNITFGESAKILTTDYPYPVNDEQNAIAVLDDKFGVYVNNLHQKGAIPETIQNVRFYEITRGELAEIIYRQYNPSVQKPSKKFVTFNTTVVNDISIENFAMTGLANSRIISFGIRNSYTLADEHNIHVEKIILTNGLEPEVVDSISEFESAVQNGEINSNTVITLIQNSSTNEVIAIYGIPRALPPNYVY